MAQADTTILLWLNSWIGTFPWLDHIARWVVSDYLVPVTLSLILLGMWFGGRTPAARELYQRAVIISMSCLGLANLAVFVINDHIQRPRPFIAHNVDPTILFYQPTDPSFPANPAALGFAVAAGIWGANRKIGLLAYTIAALFSISRVYAGVFYPLDVVAGALIGIVIVVLFSRVMSLIEPLPTIVLKVVQHLYLA